MGMENYLAVLQALQQLPQGTGGGPTLGPAPLPPPTPDFIRFPMPESPPPAPAAPLSQALINQYRALAPAPPTPPPPQAPPGLLGRIGLALQGFGAGVQGQGPQFLAQLRAEREQPQREYQARLERYNEQQAQFGLAGIQAAERAEEKRQAQQSAIAQKRFEIDLQDRARQMGFTHAEDMANLKFTLDQKLKREQFDAQADRQQAKIQAEMDKVDKEIKAASDRQDKQLKQQLMEKRMELGAAWQRANLGRVNATLVRPDGSVLGIVPYEHLKFNKFGDPEGFPQGTQVRLPGFQPESPPGLPGPYNPEQHPGSVSARSVGITPATGTNFNLGGTPTEAPGGKTVTMNQVKQSAQKAGINVDKAVKQFKDAGYSIQQ